MIISAENRTGIGYLRKLIPIDKLLDLPYNTDTLNAKKQFQSMDFL